MRKILSEVLEKVEGMYRKMGDRMPNACFHGKYDDHTGLKDNWTNGFWPGILWLAYQETGCQEYALQAEKLEERMDEIFLDPDRYSHDAGFMWLLSAVADWRMTGSERSARRGLQAAYMLAGRFNPAGNFIRAWEGRQEGIEGYAIIDCMMNLPLLYWASEYTGDPRFANIAERHTQTAAEYFIREDGSSRHICVFDAADGRYLHELGGQGYGAGSAWSRGNAWALYGFALACRHAGEEGYLDLTERIAGFYLEHLPEDNVPFADFKAPPEENVHKDSSAAAAAASGLILLGQLEAEKGRESGEEYLAGADRILRSLYGNYRDSEESEAILLHGCAAYHAEERARDIGLIFGDYFFLEALVRRNGGQGLF